MDDATTEATVSRDDKHGKVAGCSIWILVTELCMDGAGRLGWREF